MMKIVAGKRLLYIMAVDAEYGRHLAKLFTPLMIGVGPVEAAANLAYALAGLVQADEKPDLVVSLGSAGSAKLPQAEVFQASSVSYRDMDASPLGFEKGTTPFLDLPKVIELPISVPGIAAASLSTGANIVSGKAYASIEADMVDMETYACLRACQLAGVPIVGLRGISDGANELQHVGDWTQYLHIIDEKLANAVERLEGAIANGLLFAPDNSVSA
ncbi:5'-methylthioadenosine/S-adenosylhomocysteine nucleosidase [Ochrobactrum pecoris]|uniref:Adenosylhomocysteine nucleosidase n=1 Tax=Brucella pecoris TaxID=867683 RepID=A0A5C5CDP6_9HYPH|nr:5'-methylthioadenosine/S-adenosylhomocysteine nucleosidase [Brucella pecoris]MBB4095830.1 adenosylhomocysteine nucleosidase [Brucella pecoris]NKW81274.1 5'-methylthioadenosine/S-adenosylhomocysteine nucleosidase [Brucella pecoris]TNV09164.1 5'-methylthioadenosine/S-adenosylhomocysteine nucleosidase [Brucella pecoris]